MLTKLRIGTWTMFRDSTEQDTDMYPLVFRRLIERNVSKIDIAINFKNELLMGKLSWVALANYRRLSCMK